MLRLTELVPEVERPALLLTIVLLALTVRVSYVASVGSPPRFSDSEEYLSYARHLLEDGSFQNDDGEPARRTPGYPLFLSVFLVLFGSDLFPIRLCQAVLDTGSVLLLYGLLRRLRYRTGALLAAALMSVYPTIVFMTGTILTETLFIFFLLSSTFLLVNGLFGEGGAFSTGAAGAVYGITALIHPSSLLLFPMLLLFVPFIDAAGRPYRKTATGLLLFLMVLMPWTVRNHLVIGTWSPGTTKPGQDLYEAVGPGATGGPRGETNFLPESVHHLSNAEQNRFLLRESVDVMIRDPIRTLRLAGIKFARTWTPLPNAPSYRGWPHVLILPLAYGLVLLLAVVGLGKVRCWTDLLLMILPVLYVALLHIVFIGSIRYRIPVMPFLIGLAGIGGTAFLGRTSS